MLLILALTGCLVNTPLYEERLAEVSDHDADGFTGDVDCDDHDATVNPDAPERCNGVDDDCDGTVDVQPSMGPEWFADGDGDGWGDDSVIACEQPSGHVDQGGDCDDANADIHPYATEDCTTDVDMNCDGSTGYADEDEDGWPACEECDDTDATTWPGADEVCDGLDNDCDLAVDEEAVDATTWYADVDGDGYGAGMERVQCDAPATWVADGNDCDDLDPTLYPGAPERCDGVDQDCDSVVDNGVLSTFYVDADGDGFGVDTTTTQACEPPEGFAVNALDCDDSEAAINPAMWERCNGEDDDCDGTVDEGAVDDTLWYEDADGDGYGAGAATEACDAPSGWVADASDCDDSASHVHPGALETCDGVDEDCDYVIDDGAVDAVWWYADDDSDGWGDAGDAVLRCEEPSGYVEDGTDCRDDDADIHPGATEWCNGVDDDCSLAVDDGAADGEAWYADVDGDGFGDPDTLEWACEAPSGHVGDDSDCDDDDDDVNPDGTEVCDNGVDDDCDGTPSGCRPADTMLTDFPAIVAGPSTDKILVGGAIGGHGVHDVDGDGADDLLVSSYQGTSAYVLYGPVEGSLTLPGDADLTFSGGTGVGGTYLSCGDANADGDADCIVADGGGGSSSEGTVSLFWGPMSSTESLSSADVVFTGESGGDRFGYGASLVGDLDGDTSADLVVSSILYDGTRGAVYLFPGPFTSSTYDETDAATTLTGDTTTSYAAPETPADIDDDGQADLLVVCSRDSTNGTDAGAGYIILGPVPGVTTTVSSAADARFWGDAGDWLSDIESAGDLSGDGATDLLVGTRKNGVGGSVQLFLDPLGSSSFAMSDADLTISGVASADEAYHSATGDFDEDGQNDLHITSVGNGTDVGFLFYGPLTTGALDVSDADVVFEGTGVFTDTFTSSTDLDGDEQDDLIISQNVGNAVYIFQEMGL